MRLFFFTFLSESFNILRFRACSFQGKSLSEQLLNARVFLRKQLYFIKSNNSRSLVNQDINSNTAIVVFSRKRTTYLNSISGRYNITPRGTQQTETQVYNLPDHQLFFYKQQQFRSVGKVIKIFNELSVNDLWAKESLHTSSYTNYTEVSMSQKQQHERDTQTR